MKRSLVWTLGLLVLVPALQAQEKSKDSPTPSEQFKKIMAEFGAARGEIIKAYRSAKTDKERDKLRVDFAALPNKFVGPVLALAEKHPKDRIATEALSWTVGNVRSGSGEVEKTLRTKLEKSSSKGVKGVACYVLAKVIAERAGLDKKLQAESEKLFARVEKEFGNLELKIRGRSLADLAKDELYVVRNLAVGKVAPEIEAEDIDGETFKLSDYRGKIVMLDFWGHW